jgi:hypothetical protein
LGGCLRVCGMRGRGGSKSPVMGPRQQAIEAGGGGLGHARGGGGGGRWVSGREGGWLAAIYI